MKIWKTFIKPQQFKIYLLLSFNVYHCKNLILLLDRIRMHCHFNNIFFCIFRIFNTEQMVTFSVCFFLFLEMVAMSLRKISIYLGHHKSLCRLLIKFKTFVSLGVDLHENVLLLSVFVGCITTQFLLVFLFTKELVYYYSYVNKYIIQELVFYSNCRELRVRTMRPCYGCDGRKDLMKRPKDLELLTQMQL